MNRRSFLGQAALLAAQPRRIPAKTVILTMDDAVKSHRTVAAPLLKELSFGATFFVTHGWMDDAANFMTWEDIAELHRMGFEIGNHTWTHRGVSVPRAAAHLSGELALVEYELSRVGVPRPVSFAYPGNGFGPEAVATLAQRGFKFARRGLVPEVAYGKAEVGSRFDPQRFHRLLIPTTGDAYPNWTFDHFRRVVSHAVEGEAVVLQFHGVPDVAHPWVHTPPENFERYMRYLKQESFRVIALRELEPYIDFDRPPDDPLLRVRSPQPRTGLLLPVELENSRSDLSYWMRVMRTHHYTAAEAAKVTGLDEAEAGVKLEAAAPLDKPLLPYPGGRHPRIGFLEGAIDPLRGTKASVFLPWDKAAYVVVDVPEAIFSNLGLLYLAHTHVPTYWNQRNVTIDNVDWQKLDGGGLHSEWTLPNKIRFGAVMRPESGQVEMELWLANGTEAPLTGLRAQICVLLARAPEFAAQTNDNKVLRAPYAAVRNAERWLTTTWERTARVWGNPRCPCLHADPSLPDCAPGETVRVRGRLWFGSIESNSAAR